MALASFLSTLTQHPAEIDFEDTIAIIDAHYQFTPTALVNCIMMPGRIMDHAKSCFLASFMSWENPRLWPALAATIGAMFY